MNKTKLIAVLSAITLAVLSGSQAKAQITFNGNYLLVGVNGGGSLINSNYTGMQYDATGSANYSVNNDFLTPGTPYQYYSLGYNGGYGVSSFYAGDSLSNLSTTDTSVAGTFQTVTTGNYGDLGFAQTLTMGQDSTILNFSVTFTNNGANTLSDVVYATGFDPDPDVYQYGSYYTTNQIVSSSVVQASGPDTTNTILIQDLTGTGLMSIDSGGWSGDYNPFEAATTGFVSGIASNDPANIGAYDNGDYALDAGWTVGDMASGASATISYNYIVNGTPVTNTSPILSSSVPDTGSTAALIAAGLAGLAVVSRRRRALA